MISNTKIYAILWLSHKGKDANEIAKELKIPLESVQDAIDTDINSNNMNKKEDSITQKIDSKNLMITHTSGKKTNSVAIMTKEASEINDIKNKSSIKSDKNIKGVFRPKG